HRRAAERGRRVAEPGCGMNGSGEGMAQRSVLVLGSDRAALESRRRMRSFRDVLARALRPYGIRVRLAKRLEELDEQAWREPELHSVSAEVLVRVRRSAARMRAIKGRNVPLVLLLDSAVAPENAAAHRRWAKVDELIDRRSAAVDEIERSVGALMRLGP